MHLKRRAWLNVGPVRVGWQKTCNYTSCEWTALTNERDAAPLIAARKADVTAPTRCGHDFSLRLMCVTCFSVTCSREDKLEWGGLKLYFFFFFFSQKVNKSVLYLVILLWSSGNNLVPLGHLPNRNQRWKRTTTEEAELAESSDRKTKEIWEKTDTEAEPRAPRQEKLQLRAPVGSRMIHQWVILCIFNNIKSKQWAEVINMFNKWASYCFWFGIRLHLSGRRG